MVTPFESDRLGPEAVIGMRVRYAPQEIDKDIANWGNSKLPAGVLDPAQSYVVERVEVHSWHTKLWLDAGGPFNSTHFVPSEADQ